MTPPRIASFCAWSCVILSAISLITAVAGSITNNEWLLWICNLTVIALPVMTLGPMVIKLIIPRYTWAMLLLQRVTPGSLAIELISWRGERRLSLARPDADGRMIAHWFMDSGIGSVQLLDCYITHPASEAHYVMLWLPLERDQRVMALLAIDTLELRSVRDGSFGRDAAHNTGIIVSWYKQALDRYCQQHPGEIDCVV